MAKNNAMLTTEIEEEEMKTKFYDKLNEIIGQKGSNNAFFNEEKYRAMIQHVNELKSGQRKKAPLDYQTLKRYDVVKVSNTDRLIFPVVEVSTSIRYYITNAEIFNIIHDAHVQIGHGGRNRMTKELQSKYKNIAAETEPLCALLEESEGDEEGIGCKTHDF